MAAKKQARTTNFAQKMWVKYELDKKERELVKTWKPSFDEVDAQIAEALGEIYRCGVSYDTERKCWLVVMQTKHDDGPHANLLLSARGSTPLKAFKQLVYKHLELFRGKWPPRDDLSEDLLIDD